MELKKLIDNMNLENIIFDDSEIFIDSIIDEKKYNILKKILKEKSLLTTNDIKEMDIRDFNKLKQEIPNLDGVGEERTNSFIEILNDIRRNKNDTNTINLEQQNSNYPIVKLIGKFKSSANYFIEIKSVLYDEFNKYIDITQVDKDGLKSKNISIKQENFNIFKNIISNIELDINLNDHLKVKEKNQEILYSKSNQESSLENKSLKQLILENEDKLYEIFKNEFGTAIKLFKAKIESFPEDGDIVKFLNNPSILDIKKYQYLKIHSKGYKTAIDIKNEFNTPTLKYTTINSLSINDKVNSNTISCIANNFNVMLGMYYDNATKSLILKCQIKDGPYADRWIEKNKKLYYCLQNESPENYKKLSFSKCANTVCKNIVFGYDLESKVYLFYRYNKKEDYIFAGNVQIEKFVDGNKAIIINIL